MSQVQKASLDINLNFEYYDSGEPTADEVLILLHGFQQSGRWIHERLHEINFKGRVISPNGLYPVPLKLKKGWILTYGWYFFNPITSSYVTDMNESVKYLQCLLEHIFKNSLGQKKIKVIGFSQGGYLAPFLAQVVKNINQVIGIHCRFRSEVLQEAYSFRLDAIHGRDDKIVEFDRSQKCHEEILQKNTGKFVGVNGGHEITSEVIEELKQLVSLS